MTQGILSTGAVVYLTGDKALMRKLAQIKESHARQVVRPAVTAGLRVIVKAAKMLCPRDTGALKASIGQKVKAYTHKNAILGLAGPRRGKAFWRRTPGGKLRKPTKYAHLVERGTVNAPAQPFLRPAADSSQGPVRNVMRTKMWEGLRRYAVRQRAKAA